MSARTQRLVEVLLFLALPFFILFWCAPVPGNTVVGDDYRRFSIDHAMALFYAIEKGSYPLYMPGFWSGQTATALSLGQLQHPMGWAAYLTPGFWSGQALVIFTLYKLLTLGLAQWLLYRLFIRLKAESAWAFLCSFIAVYNLRMLDCFRFGAALEAYTGFIFVCVSAGYCWLEPARRRYPFLLILSGYWLLTSGHLQMAYYGLLGAACITLLLPWYCRGFDTGPSLEKRSLLRFYLVAAGCMLLAFLLSASHLLPYYLEFVRTNCGRVEQGYNYSLIWADRWRGVVAGLFYTMRGSINGNAGGSSLMVLALLAPLWLVVRKKSGRLVPLFVAWLLLALLWLATMGADTPVHHAVWEWLPFAHSMRAPGRLGLPLPLLAALLLLALLPGRNEQRSRTGQVIILAAAALYSVVWAYFLLTGTASVDAALHWRADITSTIQALTQLTGLLSLLLLALCYHANRIRWKAGLMLCVLLQSGLALYFGNHVEPMIRSVSLEQMEYGMSRHPGRYFLHVGGVMGTQDHCVFDKEIRSSPLSVEEQKSYLYPPLAVISSRVRFMPDRAVFFKQLKAGKPQAVWLEGTPEKTPEKTEAAAARPIRPRIQLSYYSHNRLQLWAVSPTASYAVIGYPFSERWQAWVNDRPATLFRANAYHLAVAIPPGQSTVDLRYHSPAQQIGMAISCAALAVLLCLGLYAARLRRKMLLAILSCVVAAALYAGWYYSLYHGQNLGGRYVWADAGR